MGTARLLMIALVVMLSASCQTMRFGGAPEPAYNVKADLETLTKKCGEAGSLEALYKDDLSTSERNKFIAGRLALINLQYLEFVRRSTSERQLIDSASDMLSLGVNLAGAAVDGAAAKTTLAAISAGISGSRTSIDKNYFYKETMPALIAAMNAERARALVPIITGMGLDVAAYCPAQAVSDLYRYYFAGTFLGAIQAIQADAGAKEQKEIAKLPRVDDKDIDLKKALTYSVQNLTDLDGAKKVLAKFNPVTVPQDVKEAKDMLQPIVRSARTPEAVAKLTLAFKEAGILKEGK
jgi:hypothetical protein